MKRQSPAMLHRELRCVVRSSFVRGRAGEQLYSHSERLHVSSLRVLLGVRCPSDTHVLQPVVIASHRCCATCLKSVPSSSR
eukprot:3936714-Rhodomonas_salina.2